MTPRIVRFSPLPALAALAYLLAVHADPAGTVWEALGLEPGWGVKVTAPGLPAVEFWQSERGLA